jgi:hypothetical protein
MSNTWKIILPALMVFNMCKSFYEQNIDAGLGWMCACTWCVAYLFSDELEKLNDE